MPRPLTWIDVLNEQAEWTTEIDLSKWLSKVLVKATAFQPKDLQEFQQDLEYMRQQLTALHFNESLDLKYINRALSEMSLEIVSSAESDGIPLLRARLKDSSPQSQLICLRHSLLLQFANFLAQCMEGQAAVSRCEGLYKERYLPQSPAGRLFDSLMEKRWRQEIAQLEAVKDDEMQRCADIFISRPKARFCSETCRFRTFQLLKQAEDPEYLAAKQRRYRHKLQS